MGRARSLAAALLHGSGMADQRQAVGRTGEDLACAELVRRGYHILERRYRTRAGEIDIVARDGGAVVFVEVKTRSSGAFGSALEAVTPRKRAQVRKMAGDYLWRSGLGEVPCRFEVVAVLIDGRSRQVEVVRDGFERW
jgi:putative endonuclease